MATLVIIRGNSGSGKTSLAKKLQEYYGRKTLLISQDIVRRDMLKEKIKLGNLSISLTETIARYDYERDLLVIVEGFYETDIYGQMLEKLHTLFYPKVLSYYYDLTFEETVRRHQTRNKKADFSPADMKRWWKECNFWGWEEAIFTDQVSLEDAFQKISKNINLL